MDRFSRLNPKTTLLFFAAQLVVTIVVFNPFFAAVSLFGACAYKMILDGRRGLRYVLTAVPFVIITVALFNFAFSHYGATELFSLGDTRFSLEPLLYGVSQGIMLSAVLVWFSVYCCVITAERFLAVVGSFAPNLAMIFSLVFSFVPRFRQNADEIAQARMLVDDGASRMKKSMNNFSALLGMTLEQSIETADSMKARGFNKKRTVYSKYRFSAKDFAVALFVAVTFVAVIFYETAGRLTFIFDPVITLNGIEPIALTAYAMLALLPVIVDLAEGTVRKIKLYQHHTLSDCSRE